MFERDQALIAEYAQASPENMAGVYRFVLATIQQPLEQVGEIKADFEEKGEASRYAFASKRTALQWLADPANVDSMYAIAMARKEAGRDALLAVFAELPGLGIVKAGFMVQLCFGVSGCLDTHNMKRLDINPNRFAAARYKGAKTEATKQAIRDEYHAAVDRLGGCEALWNSWCDYVATLRPAKWESGDVVSRYHSAVIAN